jgi:hypothetical protein
MSEHVTNQDNEVVIIDLSDQAVFVTADVEYHEFPNLVSAPESCPEVREVPPPGLAGGVVPVVQGFFSVGMILGELAQSLARDDVHPPWLIAVTHINIGLGHDPSCPDL